MEKKPIEAADPDALTRPMINGQEIDGAEMGRESRLVGTTLQEKYQILEVIGEGGMSTVYKARHVKLKKEVAIKMLKPHLASNQQSLQRFDQEAEAASALNHPNIVSIQDYGVSASGSPYLVMDYLEGKSLHTLIEELHHLPVDRAVKIFIQICSALAQAHEKGVVHRDLKPSNVLLIERDTERDFVKIVDFGIAKLLPQEDRQMANLTQTGDVFGSPLYMSPEQCKGEKLGVTSDIYSMGCLMYETLCGTPPIQGDNMLEILYRHLNEAPRQFKKISKTLQIPHQLEALVFKALSKEPPDRQQSMTQLKDELMDFYKQRHSGFIGRVTSAMRIAKARRRPLKTTEKVAIAVACIFFITASRFAQRLFELYFVSAYKQALNQKLAWQEDEPAPPEPVQNAPFSDYSVPLALARADSMLRQNPMDPQPAVDSLTGAAISYMRSKYYKEAEELFDKALQISVRVNGDEGMPTLKVRMLLADCYFEEPNYPQAEHEYETLFADAAKLAMKYKSPFVMPAAQLGDVYYFQRKYPQAQKAYELALHLKEEQTTADREMQQSFSLSRTGHGLSTSDALVRSRLGDLYRMRDKDELAHKMYSQALKEWIDLRGEGNRDVAICHAYLAITSDKLGKKEQAIDEYQKAIHDMRKAMGKEHPYVACVLIHYADFLWRQNQWVQALQARLQAQDIFANREPD